MASWPLITCTGLAVGVLYGIFGVGGSSFATPVLGLLGVPGLVAITAPLPATIPAAVVGAAAYARRGEVEWELARWSIAGGVPGTIAGALLSRLAGGGPLLVVSGAVLGIVGIRILAPIPDSKRVRGRARRRRAVVVPLAALIGGFTGLLANGGGFLLVPVYVVVLGLTMPESAGTSLVVIAVLAVPTLVTHWLAGHIDWAVAGTFALGAIPGALIGPTVTRYTGSESLRKAFGVLLIGFAVYFLTHRILQGTS
jgi:uncharacterized protein